MARTVTFGDLKTRARDRADASGDTSWVTNRELERYLDAAFTELTDLLVVADIHLFETTSNVTTDGTNDAFAVPATLYKLLAVDYRWSASPARYVEVPVITFAERNRYTALNVSSLYGAYAAGYRLVGSTVKFAPLPPSGQVYRLTYIPAAAELAHLAADWLPFTVYAVGTTVRNGDNIYVCTVGGSSAVAGGPTGTGTGIVDSGVTWNFSIAVDNTTIDGLGGYDELMVVIAAMKMATKEGDSEGLAVLARDRDDLIARIAQMAVDRQPVQSMAGGRDEDDWGGVDARSNLVRWRDRD